MSGWGIRSLKGIVALAAAMLFACASHAAPLEPSCQASATLATNPLVSAGPKAPEWHCDGRLADYRAERALLRFDIAPGMETPHYLTSRASDFSAVTVWAIDADGSTHEARLTMDDARLLGRGIRFALPLQYVSEDTRQVVVAIDEAWVAPLVADARIVGSPDEVLWPSDALLAVAAICGLLVMPLLFDLAFYRVLRARFLLWHWMSVFGMLSLTLVTSGLILEMVDLDLWQLSLLFPLASLVGVCSAAMFAADLFEEGCLPDVMRRLLRYCAALTAASSLLYACKLPALRVHGIDAYYLAFVPLIALFFVALVWAMVRGSRAARYQFVACLPIWVVSLVRIFSNIGVGDGPQDQVFNFSAAIAFELIVTSLGAAERFMALKHERDRARAETAAMEALSERDPLTGLLNRRAIESRFDDLKRQGFDTLALLDLDRFKAVNDTHGHQLGDEVLCAAARALQVPGERDAIAMRLGGEEFMLLLRGAGARNRAEQLRQAITRRVAEDVAALDLPVTASMGVIEMPRDAVETVTFDELYARADMLLYEAKEAGRNRAMHERLTLFVAGGTTTKRNTVAA